MLPGGFPQNQRTISCFGAKMHLRRCSKDKFPGENVPGPLIGEVRKLENSIQIASEKIEEALATPGFVPTRSRYSLKD